jgi:hypothetical protein
MMVVDFIPKDGTLLQEEGGISIYVVLGGARFVKERITISFPPRSRG